MPQGPVTNASGNRWYYWRSEDGKTTERHMSVTTILSLGIPKPALIEWAARVTAEFAFDNLDALYAMRKRAEKAPPTEQEDVYAQQRTAAVDFLRGERRRSTARAALRGTDIHKAIEALKVGKPWPEVREAARPWYEQFQKMYADHAPIFLQAEAKVINRRRRYGGQLDATGVWPSLAGAKKPDGELWFPKPWGDERGPILIDDYKVRGDDKRAAWPENALQLSAYANADFVCGPEGSEIPLPKIDGAIVVCLRENSYDIVPVEIGEEVFNSFLFCYEVARWQEIGSSDVIGQPISAPAEETVEVQA
jgi:hypothetical protein